MTNKPSIKKPYREPVIDDLFHFYMESDLLEAKDYHIYLDRAKKYVVAVDPEFRESLKNKELAPTPDMFDYSGHSRPIALQLLVSFDNFCKAVHDVITDHVVFTATSKPVAKRAARETMAV